MMGAFRNPEGRLRAYSIFDSNTVRHLVRQPFWARRRSTIPGRAGRNDGLIFQEINGES